jgi:hypothetical protein
MDGYLSSCAGFEPAPGVAVTIVIANMAVWLEDVEDACTMNLPEALDAIKARLSQNYKPPYTRNEIALAAKVLSRRTQRAHFTSVHISVLRSN